MCRISGRNPEAKRAFASEFINDIERPSRNREPSQSRTVPAPAQTFSKKFQGQESIGSYRFVIKSKMKDKGMTAVTKEKP